MTLRVLIRSAALTASLIMHFAVPAHPQTATPRPETPHQVKKIYVEPFTGKLGGSEIRQQIIDGLRKSSEIEIAPDPASADAFLKGTGEIWVRAYVSVNTRATASNAYPVYGGFLSAQITDKDEKMLSSYLVTPRRSASSGFEQDLAAQLVKQILASLHNSTEEPARTQPTQNSTLRVAGASFPAPLYLAWFSSFRQHHPSIFITYDALGSDAGIQQLREGKLTFAASDVPLSSAQTASMPTPVLQFATVLGAIVPIYNLPNVGPDLHFTPEILTDIYLGKIQRWNDPRIAAINRHVTLPDHEIVVVHRSDGSGSTFVWTDFLTKTDSDWSKAVGTGTTVNWPIGKGAQGNDGMAAAVAGTPDSIGYTELTYAIQRQLTYGSVRNAAGRFIQANLISLAAAAESTDKIDSPITNAPQKDAYPIASFTWLLIPQSIPDPATKSAVAEFLEWMLTTGQKECSALAYIPLPKQIVTRELQLLSTFKSKESHQLSAASPSQP